MFLYRYTNITILLLPPQPQTEPSSSQASEWHEPAATDTETVVVTDVVTDIATDIVTDVVVQRVARVCGNSYSYRNSNRHSSTVSGTSLRRYQRCASPLRLLSLLFWMLSHITITFTMIIMIVVITSAIASTITTAFILTITISEGTLLVPILMRLNIFRISSQPSICLC